MDFTARMSWTIWSASPGKIRRRSRRWNKPWRRNQAARAQAEARAQQAENKAAEAVADREAFEQTLAESRQAQEKITAALAEAEAQVAALREKVNDLEPGAESWRRIKDTAGDIEVSAHERAQRIIQSAQDQAAEIRAEGVRWILELQARWPAPQRGS